MTRSPSKPAPANAAQTTTIGVLQRKCACGRSSPGLSGDCEECRQAKVLGLQARLAVSAAGDPFEREADHAAAQVLGMHSTGAGRLRHAPPRISRLARTATAERPAPAGVAATLRSPGEPLSASARAFFEPRFGHDFSHVRVHRDGQAAASARAVAAHAYTVGEHVVFATGRYAPDSRSGRALLAHELAHVIQQRPVVQRSAASFEPRARSNGPDDDEPLPEAPAGVEEHHEDHEAGGIGAVLQRQPDDLLETSWPEKTEAAMIRAQSAAEQECVAATPPDPAECEPSRSLTWADFNGRARRAGRFGAMTFSTLRERAMNTALLRCMPHSAAAAGAPARGIQAFFNPGRSWVKPEFANPGDPAHNGCQRPVASCQRFFDRLRAGRTGNWGLDPSPDGRCPASARPRGDQASSRAACGTLVARDCADRAAAESTRLLAHEQGHFNLTCAMARKANASLTTAPNLAALLRAARQTLSRQQRLYDRQTNHGCNTADQARWEADIAAGLPAVTITVPTGRRGRRGRRR